MVVALIHVSYLSLQLTLIRNDSDLNDRIGSLSHGLYVVHCHLRQCVAHICTDLKSIDGVIRRTQRV